MGKSGVRYGSLKRAALVAALAALSMSVSAQAIPGEDGVRIAVRTVKYRRYGGDARTFSSPELKWPRGGAALRLSSMDAAGRIVETEGVEALAPRDVNFDGEKESLFHADGIRMYNGLLGSGIDMFEDCTICVKTFDGIPEIVFTYFNGSGAGESGLTQRTTYSAVGRTITMRSTEPGRKETVIRYVFGSDGRLASTGMAPPPLVGLKGSPDTILYADKRGAVFYSAIKPQPISFERLAPGTRLTAFMDGSDGGAAGSEASGGFMHVLTPEDEIGWCLFSELSRK